MTELSPELKGFGFNHKVMIKGSCHPTMMCRVLNDGSASWNLDEGFWV